jgi:SMI1 / KNR4 family (SUKH-1)
VRLSNSGPPVTEADVAAFERRVGITLPADYRRFLLEVNGGDGPADHSGYPANRYWSLHWLGGPVSDEDVAAVGGDWSWWESYDRRDLEFGVRGMWSSGLSRAWLPVAAVHHEDLLLVRVADGSVWEMFLVEEPSDDRCTRVAGSFGELGIGRTVDNDQP